MTKETDGNGAMDAAQARMVSAPPMKPGVTYVLMPSPLLAELVKILRDMPYEKVERIMRGLGECQPVQSNPVARPAPAPAPAPAEPPKA